MGIVIDSLGVEAIKGPYERTTERERNIERASYGFMEVVRVPFNSTGLLTSQSDSIKDVELGKGGIVMSTQVVVLTPDGANTIDVGLAKADDAVPGDSFTDDPNGLVAAGSLGSAGIVEGTGALVGIETTARTKLTAAVSGGTASEGYIVVTFMGGSNYFDNNPKVDV